MKPETIKKLQETVPELRELLAFLASEAAKLNMLDSVPESGSHIDIALEVLARKRAYETLTKMLTPLIGSIESVSGVDPKEFVV